MSANINEAINQVMQSVGYVRKQRGESLNYSYAGEAALIQALRPAMVDAGIYVHVVDVRDVKETEYTTSRGNTMRDVSLTMVLRFVHAPSGTHIDVVARGEGADQGDKANNKAMTGAYKYGLRQTFCIETGDDPDVRRSIPRGAAVPAKPDGERGRRDTAALYDEPATVAHPGPGQAKPNGDTAKAEPGEYKPAVVKITNGKTAAEWRVLVKEFVKAHPEYATVVRGETTSEPNFYHVLGAAAKCGIDTVTDENFRDVVMAITRRASEKQAGKA